MLVFSVGVGVVPLCPAIEAINQRVFRKQLSITADQLTRVVCGIVRAPLSSYPLTSTLLTRALTLGTPPPAQHRQIAHVRN